MFQQGRSNTISPDRERLRLRAYRLGAKALQLKTAKKPWIELHYPAEDADLAAAWLEGWGDMDEELSRRQHVGLQRVTAGASTVLQD